MRHSAQAERPGWSPGPVRNPAIPVAPASCRQEQKRDAQKPSCCRPRPPGRPGQISSQNRCRPPQRQAPSHPKPQTRQFVIQYKSMAQWPDNSMTQSLLIESSLYCLCAEALWPPALAWRRRIGSLPYPSPKHRRFAQSLPYRSLIRSRAHQVRRRKENKARRAGHGLHRIWNFSFFIGSSLCCLFVGAHGPPAGGRSYCIYKLAPRVPTGQVSTPCACQLAFHMLNLFSVNPRPDLPPPEQALASVPE